MSFVDADPRSHLTSLGPSAKAATSYGEASYSKYYESDPQIAEELERSWVARAQNFVVVYSMLRSGAVLERLGEADEYFLLAPELSASMHVRAGGESIDLTGATVSIIPPGDSSIEFLCDATVARVFTSRALDLCSLSSNARAYDSPAPNLAPLEDWPEPVGGYRTRVYDLDVPVDSARFGRIWRSRCLMINYSYPRPGPRDVRKMSPHTHDDFEQGSLCLSGTFVHHLRWPWSTDARLWREDTHEICAGPSLAIIPSLVLHTSQQCGVDVNQLVDIFAPPRVDFSSQVGWVLNADDYPVRAVV